MSSVMSPAMKGAMMQPNAAGQKKGFFFGARLRNQPLPSQAFSAGNTLSFVCKRVGYLARIWLFIRGTMNVQNNTTLTALGPWQILNRIKVEFNQGNVTVYDCSGYGAFLVGGLIERGGLMSKAGMGDTVPNPTRYSAPVLAGNNVWHLAYCIPIAVNLADDGFSTGLLNLQAPEVEVDVQVTCGANLDAVTALGTGTGLAATIYPVVEYFEVPDPNRFMQPAKVFHRVFEQNQSVTATGLNTYTLPRLGNLLQLIHYMRINSALSAAIDFFELKLNYSDSVFRRDEWFMQQLNRLHHSVEWPTGVYIWDLFHSLQDMTRGSYRDTLNTEKVTTFESNIYVTDGTVLGASGNLINSVRRVIQPIAR